MSIDDDPVRAAIRSAPQMSPEMAAACRAMMAGAKPTPPGALLRAGHFGHPWSHDVIVYDPSGQHRIVASCPTMEARDAAMRLLGGP